MGNDIAINVTAGPPLGNNIAKIKPCYLITLEDANGKTKNLTRLISIDKPEFLPGFVQVKGLFCDQDEDTIINSFSDILTNAKKELILELYLPWHRIHSVRSLIFKAK
jgi:hypothetical protein